jgi:hypothetical protein
MRATQNIMEVKMELTDLPALFDFLGSSIASGRSQNKRRSRTPRTPSATKTAASFVPLVEADRLFFRLVFHGGNSPTHLVHAMATESKPQKIAHVFRKAFEGVWARISRADCQSMVNYWHDEPLAASLSSEDATAYATLPRPLIQIADGESLDHVPKRFGHDLTFTTALVRGDPKQLRLEIARALVYVCRYATRAHWLLVERLIEGPLALWERTHGPNASDTTREKKESALEKRFLHAHAAAVAENLGKWGFLAR